MSGNRARVQDLVDSLREGLETQDIEKTAEARTLSRLARNSGVKIASEVEVEDLDNMSLDELLALSRTILDDGGQSDDYGYDEQEKVAQELMEDQLAVQIATHAFQQEMYLIKQANLLGVCRFCKENDAMTGTTICVDCGSEG